MRLIKVSAPQGKGAHVAQTAFSVGIKEVSIQPAESHSADGETKTKDVVDVHTSTPKGKQFVDALLESDFFNRKDYSIQVRQPRSIISSDSLQELTKPLVDPATDVLEELWQASHITFGFVGRIFIAACLLGYGLIHQKTLIIVAALLFLPLLPLLLGTGFGAWTKKPKLVVQALLAFVTATVLLGAGGALVAAFSNPPVQYDEFNSLGVTFLISAAVGIAAGLANIDDVGNRAMIGLAATAQIAIVPVWFGVCLVLGFPTTTASDEIGARALSFLVTIVTVILASLTVYVLSNAASNSLRKVKSEK